MNALFNFATYNLLLYFLCMSFLRRKEHSRRLLTIEEYIKEGMEFTKKELDNLRKYCSQQDPWSLVIKFKYKRNL